MKKRNKFSIIEDVVKNQQCTKISMLVGTKRRTVLLDYQTANLLLNLFNNAPLENRTKLEALGWDRLCNMAWATQGKNA